MGISKMVTKNNLKSMMSKTHEHFPSHLLYAPNLLIFYKGTKSNIHHLSNLFSKYVEASGQMLSLSKSIIFAGKITSTRLNYVMELTGFSKGGIPFIYLRIPIFKGKVKASYFQPIVNRLMPNLFAWKAFYFLLLVELLCSKQ